MRVPPAPPHTLLQRVRPCPGCPTRAQRLAGYPFPPAVVVPPLAGSAGKANKGAPASTHPLTRWRCIHTGTDAESGAVTVAARQPVIRYDQRTQQVHGNQDNARHDLIISAAAAATDAVSLPLLHVTLASQQAILALLLERVDVALDDDADPTAAAAIAVPGEDGSHPQEPSVAAGVPRRGRCCARRSALHPPGTSGSKVAKVRSRNDGSLLIRAR